MKFKDLFKKTTTKELKKELEMEELKLKISQTRDKKRQAKIQLKQKIKETKRKTSSLKNPGLRKAGKIAKKLAIGFGENIASSYEMQQQSFNQPKKRSKSRKRKPKKQMGFENPFDLGF